MMPLGSLAAARTAKHCISNGLYQKKMEEIHGDDWLQFDKLVKKKMKGVPLSTSEEEKQ